MNPEQAVTILPRHWRGVRRNHVKVQSKFNAAVFDTETCFSNVFATGFFDGTTLSIFHGAKRDHLRWFLDQCKNLANGNGTPVVAGHYIKFDLGVLFWQILKPTRFNHMAAPRRSHFSMLDPKCEIELFWTRPTFGKIRFGHRTVYLIDTFSFFPMSLRRALRAIGSAHRKHGKPKGLGRRIIPLKELSPYLRGDLRGGYDLLRTILKFHEEYQVRLCVSSPMMAGKIFRHYYLKKDFKEPSRKLMVAGLLSYHGGKNSFIVSPGWYQKCWDLDINSAYAEAMRQLPDFSNGKWLRGEGKAFVFKYPHGIYKISCWVENCKWGLVYTHDFKRTSGRVENIWVTGYELIEGFNSGHIKEGDFRGWGFKTNKRITTSPFKRYVDDFYEKKKNATDPAWREFFKHMLTDLYGKFIARTEDDDGNMVAGSMFDPVIASLITGFVRARIHGLEHRYNALHTATDGFITQRRPVQSEIGPAIGQLKQENFGPVVILRNKLYLHYDESGKLKKTGLHGFELGPEKLLKLWKSAKRTYRVERLMSWAEAWHTGVPPGMPFYRKKELILK